MYLEFFALYCYLRSAFFANFLFVNRTIILLELFTDETIRWHAPISFAETLTSILPNTSIISRSRF